VTKQAENNRLLFLFVCRFPKSSLRTPAFFPGTMTAADVKIQEDIHVAVQLSSSVRAMEWNVVISVHEKGFRKAADAFRKFGIVRKTEFFNVLLLRTENIPALLEEFRIRYERTPESLAFLARLVPAARTFTFHAKEEFRAKAQDIVLGWAPRLAGKSFHVRIRRRGFKGKITSPEEERFLNEVLLRRVAAGGAEGRIAFEDPEAIIAVETVGTWAGLSIWTREELNRYPFVRV
jgi:tRNA(Ser,Leu) C12 N-acetylase TAN1